MLRQFLLTACFLFSCHTLFSQVIISGKVVDSQNGEPLPFAHITLEGNELGTVTNASGKFRFLVPVKYKNGVLSFSFLGYETFQIQIAELKPSVTVRLKADALTLREAVVTEVTGRSVIERAIEKIPDNHQGKEHISTGFYRVVSQRESGHLHLSEAEFDVYRSSDLSQNLFRLNKVRAVKDERNAHGISVGQRPRGIINADIVNFRDGSGLLNKKGLKDHNFFLSGIISYEGTDVYLVEVTHKEGIKRPGYNGKIYIDKSTLAFLAFDLEVDPESIAYLKFGSFAVRAAMKLLSMQGKVLTGHTKIRYKRIGDKYYLNDVQDEAIFSLSSKAQHFDFEVNSKYQYVVTHINTKDVTPFSKDETLGKGKFIEHQEDYFDDEFWAAHNIILPDEDFAAIAKEIQEKNDGTKVKNGIDDVIHKFPRLKSARVDSILTYYNREGLFNGSALVAYKGKALLKKSYNNEITENRPHTQYRIGSTSKTFTSALVQLLTLEGKLNVQDSVGQYLPDYVHPQLTLSQLMSHQSGVPNYLDTEENKTKILSKIFSTQELVEKYCSDSLEFVPGSQFKYSNSGFIILAAIIEKVTGKPFGQVLQEKIFTPLEMRQTNFNDPSKSKQLTVGYSYGLREPKVYIQNLIGTGGIVSTTDDLLKWSQSFSTEKLLPQNKIEELFEPRATFHEYQADYGYGWLIDKFGFSESKQHKIQYHPGTSLGFFSMLARQPDKGITIVLLSNTGEFPRFDMTDLILDQLNFTRPEKYEK